MHYAVLLYDDERKWENISPSDQQAVMQAHGRFAETAQARGVAILDGHQLHDTKAAVSVRWRGGDATVTEGPYAETSEQFGGLYVIDAPDLDATIELVKLLPHISEIRPTVVHGSETSDDAQPATAAPAGDTYAVLLYGDEEPWANATEAERAAMYDKHRLFGESVFAAGAAVVGGSELAHSNTATTLRPQGGEWLITDGPFAETVEQLTGFYMIKAPTVDLVVQLVHGLPGGTTEIRPTIAGNM